MVTLRKALLIALLLFLFVVAAMGGSLQQMKWGSDRYNPPNGAVFISGEDWGGSTIGAGEDPLADKSGTGNDITTATGYTLVDSGDANLNACIQTTPALMQPDVDASLDVGTGDFTVSLWINTTYDATRQGLMFDGVPADAQYWFVDINSSSRLRARIFDSSTTVTSTDDGAALDDGNWHLCTIVFDRSGNMTRYVDGAAYGTADSITGPSGDVGLGGIFIGKISYDDFGTEGLIGKLDDVRLYRRALSAAEATNLYDWVSVSDTSLQAWYDFEGGGTTILDDLSVQENDGTIIGATYAPTAGPNGGPAYLLNGTISDGFNLGNIAPMEEMTTLWWVNLDSLSGPNHNTLWERNAGVAQEGQYTRVNHTTGYVYTDANVSNQMFSATTTTGLTVGVWYRIAVTVSVSANILRIYVNGVEAKTGAPSATTRPPSNSEVFIGTDHRGFGFFSGYIKGIAQHYRVLSVAEIKADYQKGAAK